MRVAGFEPVRGAIMGAAALAAAASLFVAMQMESEPTLLILPVLAVMPLARRRGAVALGLWCTSGLLLGAFIVLGALSIGHFYLPSFVALLAAGVHRRKANMSSAPGS